MFLVLLLYALFASVFIIAKSTLQYVEPFFLVGSRMMMAGVILLAYQFFRNRQDFNFPKHCLWKMVCLAFFNIYLTNVFEFWGLKYLTSSKTCFIYSLSPFISALFAYFIFSEKLTSKKWIGLIIGFGGCMPILLHESAQEELTGHFWIFSWAEIAVIIASTCSVYGWILLQQLVRDYRYSPVMANGVSMLMGGGMALMHSMIVEKWDPVPVMSVMPFLEGSILLIIISNLICYNLYGVLLKRHSATFMSFAGFSTPIFTALFGWLYLGEVVAWPFYLSAVIVFIGLLIFRQEELEREYYSISKTAPN